MKGYSKNDAFFQRPTANIEKSCDVWYYNAPMGHTTLGFMMLTISKASGLSRNYTQCKRDQSHSIGSCWTEHRRNNVRNRNEQSIKSYINAPSMAQHKPATSCQVNVSSSSSLAPSSSSVAVREVFERTMHIVVDLYSGVPHSMSLEGVNYTLMCTLHQRRNKQC